MYMGSPVTAPQHLREAEAVQLTVALGRSWCGNDFFNAEVDGMLVSYECTGNWRVEAYKKDPTPFDEALASQIAESHGIAEPYIGRTAVGHSRNLCFHTEEGGWEEWGVPAPFFATGTILGVEGQPVVQRRFGDVMGITRDSAPSVRLPSYRIGVVLELSDIAIRHNMRLEEELPNADRALVPIRFFPRAMDYFSRLASSQLRGQN